MDSSPLRLQKLPPPPAECQAAAACKTKPRARRGFMLTAIDNLRVAKVTAGSIGPSRANPQRALEMPLAVLREVVQH